MKLYFAGCARDCAQDLAPNISALLAIGENEWCDELKIFIAENSSKDTTREVILRLAERDHRVIPLLLEDLDQQIPVREARIAFCRDHLLSEIIKQSSNGLYIPIDMDSTMASSLVACSFFLACKFVESGKASGVFPSSYPYYYDIHALREHRWCPASCWKEVEENVSKSSFWNLLVLIRYVYSRQKPHTYLKAIGPISVQSAFGGVGIYSLAKVIRHAAHYSSDNLANVDRKLCEHVVFNSFFGDLALLPEWVVAAPEGHIEFRLRSHYKKVRSLIGALLNDTKRLLRCIRHRSPLTMIFPTQSYSVSKHL